MLAAVRVANSCLSFWVCLCEGDQLVELGVMPFAQLRFRTTLFLDLQVPLVKDYGRYLARPMPVTLNQDVCVVGCDLVDEPIQDSTKSWSRRDTL